VHAQVNTAQAATRTVFFHSAPADTGAASASQRAPHQSYHERRAHAEAQRIREQARARQAAQEAELASFSPHPVLHKASRPPRPPGWRADWYATSMFGGSSVECSTAELPLLRQHAQRNSSSLPHAAMIAEEDLLRHSTYKCVPTLRRACKARSLDSSSLRCKCV
jgi:hypothetical protein